MSNRTPSPLRALLLVLPTVHHPLLLIILTSGSPSNTTPYLSHSFLHCGRTRTTATLAIQIPLSNLSVNVPSRSSVTPIVTEKYEQFQTRPCSPVTNFKTLSQPALLDLHFTAHRQKDAARASDKRRPKNIPDSTKAGRIRQGQRR
ncbi:hypothetical protein EW146_g1091 [Bondarzewia mesenterica]|uniref:Secreted protein n=1 Tax=Bondarzewia mesenterica TaxID=1095465 RepID=A0A4S4M6F0_9AGAM|nr:hypothetical protein EW146_g1091 [Bondarzewia mesenterica]